MNDTSNKFIHSLKIFKNCYRLEKEDFSLTSKILSNLSTYFVISASISFTFIQLKVMSRRHVGNLGILNAILFPFGITGFYYFYYCEEEMKRIRQKYPYDLDFSKLERKNLFFQLQMKKKEQQLNDQEPKKEQKQPNQ